MSFLFNSFSFISFSETGQAVNNNDDMFNVENGHYCKDATKLGFMKAMHMFALKDAQHILVSMDFSKYKTICDLGGKFIA